MLQKLEAPDLFCPACARATAQRHRYRVNGCEIVQCAECGLGRSETSGFDPAAYYTEAYFSGARPDGYADYPGAEEVLRREFARTVAFLRRYRAGGTLLELGCAYGFFLQEARRFFDVAGIELAAEAAEHCRRAGLDVTDGLADAARIERRGPLDVVVLLDVIEHLADPRETLTLCARQLKAGGVIMITTGDFGSLAARVAGARWRLMTPPQHLWFFSEESMRRLAAPLGLEIVCCDRPWKLVPVSLIAFQLRRMLGFGAPKPTKGSAIGVPVNLFDAMRIVMRKPASP